MTKNTGVTVPYDGFISVCCSIPSGRNLQFYKSTDNGTTWNLFYDISIGNESTMRGDAIVYVQKGEFVKWASDSSSIALRYVKAQWFKKRDYSNK